jgi:hypothetical protein
MMQSFEREQHSNEACLDCTVGIEMNMLEVRRKSTDYVFDHTGDNVVVSTTLCNAMLRGNLRACRSPGKRRRLDDVYIEAGCVFIFVCDRSRYLVASS